MTKEQTMKLTVLYIKALSEAGSVFERDYDDGVKAMRKVFDIIGFDYEEVERLYDETEDNNYE